MTVLPAFGGDTINARCESQGTDRVDHPLDLGGARARRLRRLEPEEARGVNGAELREFRAVRGLLGPKAVDRLDPPVVERDEVALPQSRQPHTGVTRTAEVAVRRQAQRAPLWGGVMNGVAIPLHGARGPGHIAFRVAGAELSLWRRRLEELGVAIEAEVTWPSGGRSLYVRDPAGNSVELATPETWGVRSRGAS